MSKIIFLDIDGPLIPGRALYMPTQAKGGMSVMVFDPCAVGWLNHICQHKGWRIVIHSSWLKYFGERETYQHCLAQGLKAQYFHKDAWCSGEINWRYTRVSKWLSDHSNEVTKYVILDDEPYSVDIDLRDSIACPHPQDIEQHLILVDFNDGITHEIMQRMHGPGFKNVLLFN